jgi:Domain of unknown function (DUF4105)
MAMLKPKRLLRVLAVAFIWLALGLVTLWAVAALYFDVRVSWLRLPLAAVFALGMLALPLLVKRRRLAAAICLGGFALVLAWWFTLKPSNNRDWQPDVAVLATATVNGNQVTIHNVRNFEYRTEADFTPRYYGKTYDLNDLESVDLICVYWGSDAIAHVMISFGFGTNDYVCFSMETRKERGEGYSTIKGFFRQYELYYVVADERDVIGLRANYRQPREQVYIFRTRVPRENQRKLFLDYIRGINELAEKPVWYNTLTENCTTGVLLHTKAYSHRARYNWKILLSGYTAEYAYEMGGLDTNLPFAELRERGHVNERAEAAGESDNFSQVIRGGMPLPTPMSLEESMHGQ